MLSSRIAPSLAKYAQLRYASYQPALMQSIITMKLPTSATGAELNRFPATNVEHGLWPSRTSNFITTRPYTMKQTPQLPSKNEIEKIFFKVLVTVWDFVRILVLWSWAMFKSKVVYNPKVQTCWKTFNSKLEQARKT